MNEPDTIDYQPLLVMDSLWRTALQGSIKFWAPGVIGSFIAINLIATPFWAFDLSAGLLILYLIILAAKVKKLKNGVWEQFATANNWSLDTETSPDVVVPPSVQFGHSRECSPVIQAQLSGVTCDLLAYRCVTGYGRSQQAHNFTIACITLAKPLPHLLLLSKKSHADVQRDLQDAENLQLEGDFGDYFSLQIEKGQEIDVLTIITPDVMQTLVDYNQAEDIEILGNNLYFIVRGDKRTVSGVQMMVKSIEGLTTQIVQNITK